MRDWIIDLLGFIGLLVLCYGLWLIYQPLAFIAFGGSLMAACILYARNTKPKGAAR